VEHPDHVDAALAHSVVDEVLPNSSRAAAGKEVGSGRADQRVLDQTGKRLIEGGGISVSLSLTPGFSGVLQNFPDVGPGFLGKAESMA
jgi:hypothetical protein